MCETCGCGNMTRKIEIKENLLNRNKCIAEINIVQFHHYGILVVNMLSSPGSGKTTILEKTIMELKNSFNIGMIEGD